MLVSVSWTACCRRGVWPRKHRKQPGSFPSIADESRKSRPETPFRGTESIASFGVARNDGQWQRTPRFHLLRAWRRLRRIPRERSRRPSSARASRSSTARSSTSLCRRLNATSRRRAHRARRSAGSSTPPPDAHVLVLVGGVAGDRGKRCLSARIFAASLACALAPASAWLLAGRALQGIGAALLVPASLAILGATFEGEARGGAVGAWAAASAVAGALGPLAGAWLVDAVGWRAILRHQPADRRRPRRGSRGARWTRAAATIRRNDLVGAAPGDGHSRRSRPSGSTALCGARRRAGAGRGRRRAALAAGVVALVAFVLRRGASRPARDDAARVCSACSTLRRRDLADALPLRCAERNRSAAAVSIDVASAGWAATAARRGAAASLARDRARLAGRRQARRARRHARAVALIRAIIVAVGLAPVRARRRRRGALHDPTCCRGSCSWRTDSRSASHRSPRR